MGLIELLIIIAVVGLVVWVLITFLPLPAPFKTVIVVVAILIVLLYVLRVVFGAGPIVVHDVPVRVETR